MKKIITLLMAITLCLSLFSCGKANENNSIKLAVLKGPTAIGMLDYIESKKPEYTLAGSADAVTASFIKGDVDIAAVPCNIASVLYNKLDGDVQVLAINTLGVLYLVDSTDSIKSFSDLSGKTVYSTGKGTTPEYVFNNLLKENGVSNVTVEYRSEATELATLLANKTAELAVLPQPYVTSVLAQDKELNIALNFTEEWKKVHNGAELVTGVIIARKSFAKKNKKAVDAFLDEYSKSVKASEDVEKTAELCVKYDIIPKKEIAKSAIPYCNIKYMDGEKMKSSVSEYLSVLYGSNPGSVGGKLPESDFYYEK